MTATTSVPDMADAPQAVRRAAALRRIVSPLTLFLMLCALLPVAFVTLYILWRGQLTPSADQWDYTVPIALNAYDGTLSLADMLRQNGDHRLFTSNVLTALLTWTTRWNLKVEMLCMALIAAVNLGFLLSLFRRDDARALPLVVLPFAWLVFSIRQQGNWLWSIQTSWFFMLVFFLAALWVVQRGGVGWRTLAVAAALTVASTFSTLHGLVAWPVLLWLLWLRGFREPRYLGAWIAIAVVTIVLYGTNYDVNKLGIDTSGNSAGLFTDPVIIAQYGLAYLGGTFMMTESKYAVPAMLLGAVGLLLVSVNAVYLWRRDGSVNRVSTWLALAAFVVGAGVITALGRARMLNDVPWHPLLSRYVSVTTLFWIAVGALGLMVVRCVQADETAGSGARTLMRANLLAFVVMTTLYVTVNAASVVAQPGTQPGVPGNGAENCVADYPVSRNTACFGQLYFNYQETVQVGNAIDSLAERRLALFRVRPAVAQHLIRLRDAQRRIVAEYADTGFRYYDFHPDFKAAAFIQPAPSRVLFRLTVPETEGAVVLRTAVWVEDGTGDGVVFRVGARGNDGVDRLLREIPFDPTVDTTLRRIRIALDNYRGQTIDVVLETFAYKGAEGSTAMWVDPVIITRAE